MVICTMLARQIIAFPAPPSLSDTLTPSARYSCGLFGHAKKLKSFAINQIQTLFANHPGYGVPLRHLRALCVSLPRASKGALSLFIDFLILCFQNLTNPFSRNPFPFTPIQNPRVLRARTSIIDRRFGNEKSVKRQAPRNFAPRLMLYIAIQCTETPFRERFGAAKPTPVD
jgi:hypothetical protein